MGDRTKAEQSFKKGIERDPTNAQCRGNYGLMLARTGREPQAMEQLEIVLRPAQVHYNLGSVYESQGKKAQAKAEYRQALALDPQFTDATTRLGELEGARAPTPGATPPSTESSVSQTE